VGPATAVVIVTHDVDPAVLARCVRSVAAAGGADLVVVVDNGGMAELPSDVTVELVRADDNHGFGAAANLGLRLAAARGFDRIALLNDDVEVTEGWLRPLHAALDADPRVGAVQPKLLLHGTEPVLVNSVGVVIGPDGAGRDVGFGEPDGPAFATGRPIEVFTGGAVLFRRELLDEVGGFDERYFLYYEDVDLALRGRELGWRYRCEPDSCVWHAQGTSTSRIGDRRRMLSDRNRLWTAVRFGRPRVVVGAFWLSIRRLRHPPRRAHLEALLGGTAAVPRLVVARVRARSHG
jgi:GT2 family glycosyltransferase